ncbi:GNAT family N-acetyltransferase [Microbulbifer agarilyticus]|uniref:GNAT family N-acetyltransferase n=1 Tax=Microbulbifer agarilyticus TaxID=260552 RepID=UPI001C946414|nr:GNAT family N-acetyltransferase [Microbulbifer agarilyticus]MBY6188806.1 GNAT family N-acetyltransferase [Microbulbifer agarilyticus]
MKIIKVDEEHIENLSKLFNLYRQFYDCSSDIDKARSFISERIHNGESIIFVVESGSELAGFIQIYPSFCSVDAVKIFILYDLYVDESGRGKGVAALLMNKAREYAIANDVKRIDLVTAKDNSPARKLYEKLGYQTALENFVNYSLNL